MTRIAVSRLPKDPGPAGWNRILPPGPPPSPLDGDTSADWLIIGAGFAGLAAAQRLSDTCPGDRIVVLDATRVGDGPAGRNSGFMIDLPHDLASDGYGGDLEANRAEIADNRAGIDFAGVMAEAYGLSKEAFNRTGKINAAATERGMALNRAYASHVRAMGEVCDEIDNKEMRDITGTTYYRGGLYTPGVATIQPAMFVRGVADGLRGRGVLIHETSPVTSLEKTAHWIATTPGGRVTSPRVILAVNGHLNSFGFLKGRFLHIFTYASMTRQLTDEEVSRMGGQKNWGVTPADPLGSSLRRISGSGGDRIVVRNQFTCDQNMEIPTGRIGRIAQTHNAAFQARFPMLNDVAMEYRWGGRLCLSLNNVQVVRELENGLFAACCQNGLGTVKGSLAGMLAADLATGRTSDVLARALRVPLPRRLPPEPFTRFGASARILFGEMRAGKEI